MSNLLAGLLFPVIIGVSLFLSLYPKKKKGNKRPSPVEFSMTRKLPVVPELGVTNVYKREKPALQIRAPKLVD